MDKKICSVYFSPTGNVEKIACKVSEAINAALEKCKEDYAYEAKSILKPCYREDEIRLESEDILLLTMPVYAGRIPNKIMPYIKEKIWGNNTPALIWASYGNRSYGDCLSEMAFLLRANGFKIIGGGAVPSEHAFAEALAKGRPDERDLNSIYAYSHEKILSIMSDEDGIKSLISNIDDEILIKGNANPQKYYQPLKENGEPALFLKAKPKTQGELCTQCKKCADNCPMGCISYDDCTLTSGICIKCQSCIKVCHTKAKYFDDGDFLSHKAMLEKNFSMLNNDIYFL